MDADEPARLCAREARLAEALDSYGVHKIGCASATEMGEETGIPCDCGLDASLAATDSLEWLEGERRKAKAEVWKALAVEQETLANVQTFCEDEWYALKAHKDRAEFYRRKAAELKGGRG